MTKDWEGMSIVHDAGNESCLFALDSEVGNKFIFEVLVLLLHSSVCVRAGACNELHFRLE